MADALTTPTHAGAEELTHAIVRPQPLGVLPLPLGYMLIPAGDDTDPVREELLQGRLPRRWPASLRAHELAATGNREGALAVLDGRTDPVAVYNRFVLDSDSTDPGHLRSVLGEFAVLVDVVRFTLGQTDVAPHCEQAGAEIAAAVLSAQASHCLASGNTEAATEFLARAVEEARLVSTPLAGLMMGAAATVSRDSGTFECMAQLQEALAALEGADGLRVARAEIHMCLAGMLHEQAQERPELLPTAIPHYHSTLQLIVRADAPLLWAAAHAGLAAAYLTMPMVEASGQLRLGVAAQSLRSALTVYTREEHPAEWASVQLNLANSLVYTPSRHQKENLVEAVEIYEALLQIRDRTTDPLGRARVLANQGNVLAHLGLFDDAKAKLYEARFLFEELGDNDSVRTVRGVLDEIARQKVLSATDDARGS